MAVAAMAGAVVRRQKKIVAAFRAAGATNPYSATTAAALKVHQGLAFRVLCRRGVLRDAGENRLYVDESRWEALRSTRRRVALGIVGTVMLVASLVILWALGH